MYWIFRHEEDECSHHEEAASWAGDRVLLVADIPNNLYSAWAQLEDSGSHRLSAADKLNMVASFKDTMRKYEKKLTNRTDRCLFKFQKKINGLGWLLIAQFRISANSTKQNRAFLNRFEGLQVLQTFFMQKNPLHCKNHFC